MMNLPCSIPTSSSPAIARGAHSHKGRGEDDVRIDHAGQRQLPESVAAAVLMTMDYPGRARLGAQSAVAGCLPPHLCRFDGTVWRDDWLATREAIRMTPVGGAAVFFAPPAGFREMFDAILRLAAELRQEVRRTVLLAHPDLEQGPVVDDSIAVDCLGGVQGRFSALVAEVWLELCEAASTAHGRLSLLNELRASTSGRVRRSS